ncbi:MAG TPA: hypothetical protein ENG45_01230 [Candidatus Aenigmarchaeota archaeon]|nr:hypothetical protein [Candidatus Aenigmarchaeota archaeon]
MKEEAFRKEKFTLAEKSILMLLQASKEPLTTREIETRIKKLRINCPDAPSHYLQRLMRRGLVKRKFSVKKRGFVWFVKR